MFKPPPLIKVNEPVPVRTLVPTSVIDPLLMVKFMLLLIVPPDLEKYCVPVFAKLKSPLPVFVAVSVIVPPVWEKLPCKFNVVIPLAAELEVY